MSTQTYAVIDPSNTIINIVVYDSSIEPPVPYPPNILVKCDASVGLNNGWTYVNGEFIAPPVIPAPEPLPSVTPTLSELQAQMAQIQAHMSTLMAVPSS